eukprot:TRINITY_DN62996_c0_g3_i1.p1 TRINITY_DN62996_c0_g3~~TRINITY_DN62996_c0_g3_i1.p1  ORF type:complete len:369 (+),score=25.55 TRINITY_DN62996_c0_g3_i1:47-1153(+)
MMTILKLVAVALIFFRHEVTPQDNVIHRIKRWYSQVIFDWNHQFECKPIDYSRQPLLVNMSFALADDQTSQGSGFVLIATNSRMLIATTAHNSRDDHNPSRNCVLLLFLEGMCIIVSIVAFLALCGHVMSSKPDKLNPTALLCSGFFILVGAVCAFTIALIVSCHESFDQTMTFALPPKDSLSDQIILNHCKELHTGGIQRVQTDMSTNNDWSLWACAKPSQVQQQYTAQPVFVDMSIPAEICCTTDTDDCCREGAADPGDILNCTMYDHLIGIGKHAVTMSSITPGMYTHDAPTQRGCSGGAVMQSGELVGIHTGAIRDGQNPVANNAFIALCACSIVEPLAEAYHQFGKTLECAKTTSITKPGLCP